MAGEDDATWRACARGDEVWAGEEEWCKEDEMGGRAERRRLVEVVVAGGCWVGAGGPTGGCSLQLEPSPAMVDGRRWRGSASGGSGGCSPHGHGAGSGQRPRGVSDPLSARQPNGPAQPPQQQPANQTGARFGISPANIIPSHQHQHSLLRNQAEVPLPVDRRHARCPHLHSGVTVAPRCQHPGARGQPRPTRPSRLLEFDVP